MTARVDTFFIPVNWFLGGPRSGNNLFYLSHFHNFAFLHAMAASGDEDGLLNDCLSDAMIYQGRARDEINAEMRQAILSALTGSTEKSSAPRQLAQVVAATPETNPILFVSDILGSKIAFDAIMKLQQAPATKSAGDRIAARTQQIFMRANQPPILALANQPLGGGKAALVREGSYSSDPLVALANLRSRAKSAAWPPGAKILKAMDAPLRVIAFTDPNDLLSYSLAKSPHFDSSAYSIVDVIMSDAPTYFGLLEMPTTAHVGYTSNAAVKRLIACGSLGSACREPSRAGRAWRLAGACFGLRQAPASGYRPLRSDRHGATIALERTRRALYLQPSQV